LIAVGRYRKLVTMANIVELAPLFADADNREFALVNGIWNSSDATVDLARERGHTYWRPVAGGLARGELVSALAIADTVVLAPTAAAITGMRQPVDGAESGRVIGHRILDAVSADFPDLHVVLISHFLVGHGHMHRNAKPHTWGLRALEAHLRGGRNPWTILRPTWLSTIHDGSYQTRLSQDQHADGLVSTASIARAVLAAVESPQSASGRTAAIFNLSIPGSADTDPVLQLATQFGSLVPDFEVADAHQTVSA
jgi:putative NAD(P)-binding protein